MEKGMERKEAMREAAKQLGMSRRDVYQSLLDME
jgi:16S rRNA (cytidine1402-2'-O)-methyltransferase